MSYVQLLWQQNTILKTSVKFFNKSCIIYLFMSLFYIEKHRTQFIGNSSINCNLFHIVVFDCILYMTHDTCNKQMPKVRCMIRSRSITRRQVMPLTYSISERCELTCRSCTGPTGGYIIGVKTRSIFLAEVELKTAQWW